MYFKFKFWMLVMSRGLPAVSERGRWGGKQEAGLSYE